MSVRAVLPLAFLLAVLPFSARSLADDDQQPPQPVTEASARALVEAYHRLDATFLRPRLAEGFAFHDVGQKQQKDRDGFFALLDQIAREYSHREMLIESVKVTTANTALVQGRWKALYNESVRLDMYFAISLAFDHEGKVRTWIDDFRHEPFDPV